LAQLDSTRQLAAGRVRLCQQAASDDQEEDLVTSQHEDTGESAHMHHYEEN